MFDPAPFQNYHFLQSREDISMLMGVLIVLDVPDLAVSTTLQLPSNILTIFLMVYGLSVVVEL